MKSVNIDLLDTKGPKVEFMDVHTEDDTRLKEQCRTQYLLRSRLNREIEIRKDHDPIFHNLWEDIADLRKKINDGFTKQREAADDALLQKLMAAITDFEEAIAEMPAEEMLTSANHLLRALGKRLQQEPKNVAIKKVLRSSIPRHEIRD